MPDLAKASDYLATSTSDLPSPVSTSPRGAILAGILVILVAFGGFAGWAAVAPLSSAVLASGVVVVENNRQDVQHLDGGIISAILVREGAEVRTGDVLLRLDPTRAQATLAIIQSQMDAARLLHARLLAEQGDEAEINLPPEILERRALPAVIDLIQGQKAIFQTRRASLSGQTQIQRQRIAQFEQQIEGLRAQERSRLRQITLIEDELSGVRQLSERGLTTRARLLALERELARLQGERGEHLSALARAQQSIGETELQILQSIKTFQEDVSKSLQDVQNQLLELQERFTAASDVLRRLEIRSPADGKVVGLAVHTVGGVISPGRTIMQIVPAMDTLMIEAQIQPTDVDGLSPGLKATVNFPALPQRTMPSLSGTLIYISADRFVDERTGAPYFKARVLIDPESLEEVGARRIIPGMPADVMIALGARTALQYLLDPLLTAIGYAMRER